MKTYKLKVKEINKGEYNILANSAEEAEAKFIAIRNCTDLVDFDDSNLIVKVEEIKSAVEFEELCNGRCEICNREKRKYCKIVEGEFKEPDEMEILKADLEDYYKEANLSIEGVGRILKEMKILNK